MKRTRPFLVALALGMAPTAASAAVCSIVSVSPVAFGAYQPFGIASVDSAGDITFRCSGVAPEDRVRIELDHGLSALGTQRRLSCPAGTLEYQLYLDAARTQIWGDGTDGRLPWESGALSDGVAVHVPVYGRIRAGQNVPAGAYADTITVTVEF